MYNLGSQYGLYGTKILMFEAKQNSGIEGKYYFVYKIISYPIRADILDGYSKLEKWIVVLADTATICVKAWYLYKGHFVI